MKKLLNTIWAVLEEMGQARAKNKIKYGWY